MCYFWCFFFQLASREIMFMCERLIELAICEKLNGAAAWSIQYIKAANKFKEKPQKRQQLWHFALCVRARCAYEIKMCRVFLKCLMRCHLASGLALKWFDAPAEYSIKFYNYFKSLDFSRHVNEIQMCHEAWLQKCTLSKIMMSVFNLFNSLSKKWFAPISYLQWISNWEETKTAYTDYGLVCSKMQQKSITK